MTIPTETEIYLIAQEMCRLSNIDPWELKQVSVGKITRNIYAYELVVAENVKPICQFLEAYNKVMVGKGVMD